MPMRLLFVIDSLASGGAQRQMVTLARGLRERGHAVEFFLYAPGDLFMDQVQAAGIPVFRHLKQHRFSVDVIRALRQRIKVGRYDVLLAYMPTPNFYAVIASRLVTDGPPVVISERSYDPPEGLPRMELFARQFYRLAACLVVNSRHQSANLCRKLPRLKDRIVTIYNGLDLQHFSPPAHEPPDSPLKLLGLSHISPYKNMLCLVRALGILAREYDLRPQVNWAGRHFDSSYRENFLYLQLVNQELENLKVTGQWQWLHERNDIASLLRKHHALVHPSYVEGLPNAVCEAMACGRPVILSNILEHPYLIEHGISGFLFDTHDPHELASSIKALHDLPPDERHAMGIQARTFAEKHFALQRLTDQYEALFKTLARS